MLDDFLKYHLRHSYFACDKWNLFHVIFWRCFIFIFIKMLDIIQKWSINYHVINAHQLLIQISNFSRAYKYFGLKFVRKRKFLITDVIVFLSNMSIEEKVVERTSICIDDMCTLVYSLKHLSVYVWLVLLDEARIQFYTSAVII